MSNVTFRVPQQRTKEAVERATGQPAVSFQMPRSSEVRGDGSGLRPHFVENVLDVFAHNPAQRDSAIERASHNLGRSIADTGISRSSGDQSLN